MKRVFNSRPNLRKFKKNFIQKLLEARCLQKIVHFNVILSEGRHGNHQNDTQHNNKKCYTQQKDTQHKNKNAILSKMTISITIKMQHSAKQQKCITQHNGTQHNGITY